MIELFREILTGVAAAALCGGAAVLFAKGKAMQEVLRLATGIAVLLAVLQPLAGFRLPDPFARLRKPEAVQTTADDTAQVLARAAAQQVEREIEQRAAMQGIPCTVHLTLAQDAQGNAEITGVQIGCSRSADTAALTQLLTTVCGIPKELQTWNWTD